MIRKGEKEKLIVIKSVIDGVFLLVALIWTLIIITKATIKYYKSQSSGYTPLLKTTVNHNYGSTTPTATDGTVSTNDDASDSTITMDVEIKSSRWTIFNWSRLILSFVQLGLFACAMQKIMEHKYQYSPNEGSKSDILHAFGIRIVFWVSLVTYIEILPV